MITSNPFCNLAFYDGAAPGGAWAHYGGGAAGGVLAHYWGAKPVDAPVHLSVPGGEPSVWHWPIRHWWSSG